MTIREYIEKTLAQLDTGTGNESAEGRYIQVQFDIGVMPINGEVRVLEDSPNRIRFTLEVKRT